MAIVSAWEGGGDFGDVLHLARMGDEAAFAALWRWLHPPLQRWLIVVARGNVEDVESEVWLSVARALGAFAGTETDFRGWVFTLARRRSIDWARRRDRQRDVAALDGIDIVDPRAASTASVEATAALEAARALLGRLTPDQREVVALRVIAGMTVAETAAVVGKSEAAVRVACHRGLRSLAQQLEAEKVTQGSMA